MKKLICITTMALVLTSAFAQHHATETKTKATAKPMHCAVMAKDEIKVADATKSKLFSDYKGKRYFFCCPNCAESFKKDPAKYAAKADSIATPKATKKKA